MNATPNSNDADKSSDKISSPKGYSLLQGLLILAIISIVVTVVLNYFSE